MNVQHNMYQKLLSEQLSYNLLNYQECDMFDISESTNDTNTILDIFGSPHCLTNYIAGNCYFNGKLSHHMTLTTKDQTEINNLDNLIHRTKPIYKKLTLFHGFEIGINYDDKNWKLNKVINFNFFLSKTPAFWVAKRFTNHFFCWLNLKTKIGSDDLPKCYYINWFDALKTLFVRKYLFCIYDGSFKHVSSDMKYPKNLEEFVYLSHRNEKFILVDIVYKYNFWFPFINKFYILVRMTQ